MIRRPEPYCASNGIQPGKPEIRKSVLRGALFFAVRRAGEGREKREGMRKKKLYKNTKIPLTTGRTDDIIVNCIIIASLWPEKAVRTAGRGKKGRGRTGKKSEADLKIT